MIMRAIRCVRGFLAFSAIPMAVFKLFAGLAPVPALAPTAVDWAPTAVAFVPHAIEPAPAAVAPSAPPGTALSQVNCARALGGAATSARVAEKMTQLVNNAVRRWRRMFAMMTPPTVCRYGGRRRAAKNRHRQHDRVVIIQCNTDLACNG